MHGQQPNHKFGLADRFYRLFRRSSDPALRLTALLAAADSEWCPAPPEGVAFTLTGRGARADVPTAPHAAQAGPWLPRLQVGHRTGAANPSAPGRQERLGSDCRSRMAKPNQRMQLTGRAIPLPRGILRKQRGLQLIRGVMPLRLSETCA